MNSWVFIVHLPDLRRAPVAGISHYFTFIKEQFFKEWCSSHAFFVHDTCSWAIATCVQGWDWMRDKRLKGFPADYKACCTFPSDLAVGLAWDWVYIKLKNITEQHFKITVDMVAVLE